MSNEIRPRRVLLLLTEVFANGGIQRFNQTFLAALRTLAMQCDVLSMQDTEEFLRRAAPYSGINITGFSGSRPRFAFATVRAIASNRYDWIVVGHINLLTMTTSALRVSVFRRVRTLLIAHGIEVWYGIGGRRRSALGSLDSILCVSNYTRERILEQAPALRPERLLVFPNALGDVWAAAARRAPAEHAGAQRFILSVTRLQKGDRYKGIVTVIEALSMLEDADLQYVIVGEGEDRPFLQLVARRFGVQHRVRFLSGITDVELTGLYERCEAFVLPSGKEGFGIVFLEAMYFGAPVIAAAEKGTLDVVRDGETGLLVRFGDSIALKKAIERLQRDPALREHIRRSGRSTVTGDGAFTFSRFVARSARALQVA